MKRCPQILVWSSVLLLFAGCSSPAPDPEEQQKTSVPGELSDLLAEDPAEIQSPVTLGRIRFEDQHEQLGVHFAHENGADERALMVQSTGGGGGWSDYDRDGWLDLYLVQGGNPTLKPPHAAGDRLLRNQQGVQFVDASTPALPVDLSFGQGMAAGDFNEDGFDDIFVSGVSEGMLLLNCGDGTFQNVSAETIGVDNRWGSSAAWFDIDLDGDLDLFVCNYCRYDVFNPVVCRKPDGSPGICHPEALDPDYSECFENLGDGRFQSAVRKWGLADKPGKALGIVAADFNNDDRPDLFVANDTMANYLYIGTETGVFKEEAVTLGCAYNTLGQYQANMGVACNDYDSNGFLDLYITTFTADSNTLFANLGPSGFRDVTRLEGLHSTTIETLGFGTVMTDLDANGCMDLFMTNGHIDDWRYKGELWKMPPEMFTYMNGTWHKYTAADVGTYFSQEFLGRAVSQGDFDNDGDMDLLVVHQNEPSALLVNHSEMGHWLRLEFLGSKSNRRGIGVKVSVTQGARTWSQQLVGGSSYLTSHEPVLFFGLGQSADPCRVSVTWPGSETKTEVQEIAVNQTIRIVEAGARVISRVEDQNRP